MKKTHIIYILLLLMAMASIFPGQVAYAAEGDATVGTSDYTWSIPSEIKLGTTSEVRITPSKVFLSGSTITMEVSAADGFVLQEDYGGTETSKIGYEIRKGTSESTDIITADNAEVLTYTADGSTTTTATQQLSFAVTNTDNVKVLGKHTGTVTFEITSRILVATFSDGETLTWTELQDTTNGTKYGYNSSKITDTGIGELAFSECTSLASITIPNSVTSISNYAFSSCKGLTSITIPDSATSIGDYAFNGCKGLTEIIVGKNNQNYKSVDGVLFNKDATTLIAYPAGKIDTSYSIPSSVTSIGEDAFEDCTSLTSIEIPNSVTSIGEDAFSRCSSLTSITIPEGSQLTSIGNSAFSYCKNLTSITIPSGVTSIGGWTFDSCENLSSITFKENSKLTSIGDDAFRFCYNLTSISIPDGVTSIGDNAFMDCKSLSNINIPNSVISIGEYAFQYCTRLTSINIPDGITSVGNSTFYGCTSLAAIIIPNSVTSIKKSSFYGCTSLTTVVFEEGSQLTSIENSAFPNCTSLTAIIIPDSVTSIGNSTFSGCTSLAAITIPDSVTSIDGYAFSRCTSLTDITYTGTQEQWNTITKGTNWDSSTGNYTVHCTDACLDNSNTVISCPIHDAGMATFNNSDGTTTTLSLRQLKAGTNSGTYGYRASVITDTSIGRYAFYYCRGLTNITVPNSVTSIGPGAFYLCDSLTSITIGNSVTSIGEYAFSSCDSLTSITIPNSVTSIGREAFDYCSSLTSITIPNSVTSIGPGAFAGCSSLPSINVDANNPNYKSIDGVLFNKDATTLIAYPAGKTGTYTIPSSVQNIGESAFDRCESLTSVTIPNSVTNIGENAFHYCSSLTSITIPNSVTIIRRDAFSYCTNATKITIPNSVTSIEDYAFSGCMDLISIEIPNSVTSIGDYAFGVCKSLTSITIPASVQSVAHSFGRCSNLSEIKVNANNQYYTSIDGVLFTKDKTKIVAYPLGKTNTSYTIPDGITTIGEDAFNYFMTTCHFTSITIPHSVTTIENLAFYHCTVKDINYNGTITDWNNIVKASRWDDNADKYLVHCTDGNICKVHTYGSTTVTTSPTCSETGTGYQTCSVCGYVNTVSIPTIAHTYGEFTITKEPTCTGTGIKQQTCSVCGFVNEITIPITHTWNDDGQCSLCGKQADGKSFKSAIPVDIGTYTATIASDNYVHSGKKIAIYKFVAPETKTYIFKATNTSYLDSYGYLFNSSQSQIKSDDDSSGNGGFKIYYLCTAGQTYYLGVAFYSSGTGNIPFSISEDTSTSSLSLRDSISTDEETTVDITNNTEATLEIDSNTEIATFQNEDESTTTLTWGDLQLPENAEKYGYCTLSEQLINGTSIECSAFAECTALKEIIIPEGITNIGEYAFGGCSNLTSITLPNTIEEIEANAFDSCSSLVNITISGTTSEWDAIIKGEDWNYEMNSDYTVHCDDNCINSDGTVIECLLHSSSDLDDTQSDSNEVISNDSETTDTTSNNPNNTETPIVSDNANDTVEPTDKTSDTTDTTLSDDNTITDSTDNGSESTTTDNTVVSPEPDASGSPSDTTTTTEAEDPFEIDINFEMATFQSVDTETEEKISTVVTWFGLQQPENRELYGYSEALVNDTAIETYAFFECDSLTEFVVPEGITSIGTAAFYNCTNLTSITIPESVTEIGENALYGCTSLQIIYFTGSQSQWDSIIKGENWNYDVQSNCLIHCNDACLDNTGSVVEIPSHFQNNANTTTDNLETKTSSETVQTETETNDITVPTNDNTTETDITEELGSVVLNDVTYSTDTDSRKINTKFYDKTESINNNASDSSLDSGVN